MAFRAFSFACLIFFTSCTVNFNNPSPARKCQTPPSGLIAWWSGDKSSSQLAYDLVNQIPGSLASISLMETQNLAAPGKGFSFGSYQSSFTANPNWNSPPGQELSVVAWFKGEPIQIMPVTRTLVQKGKRNPDFDTLSAEIFDVTTIHPLAKGFIGGIFDGRYTYFLSAQAGVNFITARYDTFGSITQTSNWKFVNPSTFNSNAGSYWGGLFDGRYIYLTPRLSTTPVARYDTYGDFSSSTAWNFFNPVTINPNAYAFDGATFDGRYVYFAPRNSTVISLAARYDTQLAFDSSDAWGFFSTLNLDSNANTYSGAITANGKIYFLSLNSTGLSAAFDVNKNFSSPLSWQTFSTNTFFPGTNGSLGGAFDGKYLYFSLNTYGVRFSVEDPLSSISSWSGSLTTISSVTARGSVFDGRYIYHSPGNNSNGISARYDTLGTFEIGGPNYTSSWKFFDFMSLAAGANGYRGATFDGRHVYFVPHQNAGVVNHGLIARVDTLKNMSSFGLTASSTVSDGFGFSLGGPRFYITTENGYQAVQSNTSLNSDWHLLVGVYTGTALRLYVDGTLVNSRPASGQIISNADFLSIGSAGITPSSLAGQTTDIQIYNKTISMDDIQKILYAGHCR